MKQIGKKERIEMISSITWCSNKVQYGKFLHR